MKYFSVLAFAFLFFGGNSAAAESETRFVSIQGNGAIAIVIEQDTSIELTDGETVEDFEHNAEKDCYGSDIRTFVADDDECKAECIAETECVSVEAHTGSCWLKTKACTPEEMNDCQNCNYYIKPQADFSRYINRDCAGDDIRGFEGTTADCAQACLDDVACLSTEAHNGYCWLKSKSCTEDKMQVFNGASYFVKHV